MAVTFERKSSLLFDVFRNHLREEGVPDDQVVELALDDDENARYRDPPELGSYLNGIVRAKNLTERIGDFSRSKKQE